MSARNKLIAIVKMGIKKQGLDDETYRAFLEIQTGKTSLRDVDDLALVRLVETMRAEGMLDKVVNTHQPTSSQWRYFDALIRERGWISRDDPKCVAWVSRTAQVAHPRFLTRQLMNKCITGLASWKRQKEGHDGNQTL